MSTPDPITSAGPTPSAPTCSARCRPTRATASRRTSPTARPAGATSTTCSVAADALPVSVPPVAPPPALKAADHGRRRAPRPSCSPPPARAPTPPAPAPARAPASAAGAARRRGSLRPGVALACAAVLLVVGGARRRAAGRRRRGHAHGRRRARSAPGADVRLEIGDDGATLVARDMPRAAARPRSTRSGSSARARIPSRRRCSGRPRADGSAEVAVPGSLDGVEAVLVTDEPPGGSDAPSKDAGDQPPSTA